MRRLNIFALLPIVFISIFTCISEEVKAQHNYEADRKTDVSMYWKETKEYVSRVELKTSE